MYRHKKTRIAIPHIRVFLLPLPRSVPAQKMYISFCKLVHFVLRIIYFSFLFCKNTLLVIIWVQNYSTIFTLTHKKKLFNKSLTHFIRL